VSALQSEPEPRFQVDAMLVKLGKYLRCLGYDAAWDERASTRDAARQAETDGRVLVTRNTRLGEEIPSPALAVVLSDDDPVRQLAILIEEFGLETHTRLFTRCIRCNVPLEPCTDATLLRERVPANVLRLYRAFYHCPACSTVFWKGSHVRNTCRKLGLEPPEEGVGG
jgi:uncharacterized protein with PIN domain